MEGPLYGETTKQQKTLLYAMAVGLGILTIAAVLGCVIVAFMDKKFTHFILVIALVVLTAAIVLFWKWYLSEHIHPKFKWIIGLLLGVLVVADIAGIVDAVVNRVPKPKPQPKCNGLYNLNNTHCYAVPKGNLRYCGLPSYCMFFSGAQQACCGNCTLGLQECLKKNWTAPQF